MIEILPLLLCPLGAAVVVAVPLLIVALVVRGYGRTLQALAERRGGRVRKGFLRHTLEYEVEGVEVRLSYRMKSKNNPGETRFHYDLSTSKGLRLAPQGVLAGVRKMFGAQDIIIGDRAFDDAFLIQGPDEDWVRGRLGPEARELLMAMRRHGAGLYLFHQPGVRVDFSPAGLIVRWRGNFVSNPAVLEEAADLADAFFRDLAGLGAAPAISVQEVLRDKKCPVCLDAVSDKARSCNSCGAHYHDECWRYLNGCAVFGCKKMYRRQQRAKA